MKPGDIVIVDRTKQAVLISLGLAYCKVDYGDGKHQFVMLSRISEKNTNNEKEK